MPPPAIVCHQPIQMLRTHTSAQYNRTAQHGYILGQVGEFLQRGMHRGTDFHNIPVLPFTIDAYIRRRFRPDSIILAVAQHPHFGCFHPPRMAYQQLKASGSVQRYRYAAPFFCRELCLLRQPDASFFPLKTGSNEKVHEKRIARMRIDKFAVLARILHACAHTAPHCLVRCRIYPVMRRTGRGEIHISSMSGMYRREDMIVQGTLVEVGITGIGTHPEKPFGQFQHIVGIACLGTFTVFHITLAIGFCHKVFAPAIPSESQRTVLYYRMPEICCRIGIRTVIRQFRDTLVSDRFGHLCIGMLVIQIVHTCRHAIEQPMMRKTFRRVQVFLVARHLISVGINLIHSAKLHVEHLLHLFIGQGRNYSDAPVAQGKKHLPGFFIPCIHPCIAQSGI